MSKRKEKNKGFVILYAVIITTVVLIVGVSLMNIMTKQLVLSSISRNAKVSYYAALSGRACAHFWRSAQTARGNVDVDGNPDSYFGGYTLENNWVGPTLPKTIICNGQEIQLEQDPINNQDVTFHFDINIGNQIVSTKVVVGPVKPDGCDQNQLIITSEGYNDSYTNADSNNSPPRLVRSLYKDKVVDFPYCN